MQSLKKSLTFRIDKRIALWHEEDGGVPIRIYGSRGMAGGGSGSRDNADGVDTEAVQCGNQ